MNKKLLAVAIAASFVAPAVMADTTVYGRINENLVHTDATGSANNWDVQSNASRFGVKGTEDLGNGMKAIFQYEWGVDASDSGDFSGRLALVGLTGGFGTVAIGRQLTPYYGSVDKTDIHQVGGMNDHYIGPLRVGNALAYVSPNFNGFSAKLALIIDGARTAATTALPAVVVGGTTVIPATPATPASGDNSVDATNLSLDYANGPLNVGFSYLDWSNSVVDTAGTPVPDQWGLGVKYNLGSFALIGQYEDQDNGNDAYGLAAEAYFGNNTLRAKYGEINMAGTAADTDTWSIGVEHKFSKRTRIFAAYEDTDVGAANTSRFGLGIRHDF